VLRVIRPEAEEERISVLRLQRLAQGGRSFRIYREKQILSYIIPTTPETIHDPPGMRPEAIDQKRTPEHPARSLFLPHQP
jgi:hypothetical protein